MADLVQTAANVVLGTGAQAENAISGEALTAGQPVYLKSSDGKYYQGQADGTPEESGTAGLSIALNSCPGANQPVRIFTGGKINLGATLTVGQIYVVSVNKGAIAPITDLVSTNYVALLGIAESTSLLRSIADARPFAPNVQKA